MKAWKTIRNAVLVIAGIALTALVTLQVVLRPKVLTGIVERIAAEYVDGDVSFRQVKAHVIKSFPHLHLEVSDFSITYPHDRYAAYDSLYPDNKRRFNLMRAGLGKELPVDTLATFRDLDLELDYVALLKKDGWNIRSLSLIRPRIFAHYYDSTAANWDILPIGKNKAKKLLPPIRISLVKLEDKPLVVFTNPVDTLHALFTMRRLSLDGKVDTRELDMAQGLLSIDSLLVTGRLPADTIAVHLEKVQLEAAERHIVGEAEAVARLATNNFGRLKVPVKLAVDGNFPKREDGALEVDLNSLALSLSSLTLEGSGSLVKLPESWEMDLKASINDCPIGELIKEYQDNVPVLRKLSTDARLSLDASAQGSYGNGLTPELNARLKVPLSSVQYEGMSRKGRVALDAKLFTGDLKAVNADVSRVFVDIVGAQIDASGSARDILGGNPLLAMDGSIKARVDSLAGVFGKDLGISGTGEIDATLSGRARLSELKLSQIGSASINCDLEGRELRVLMPTDSIDAYIPALKLNLATKGNKINKNMPQGERVLALKADLDSLDVNLGGTFVRGSGVRLLAQNSAEILRGGKELTPLMGLLKVKRLRMKDTGGLSIGIRDNVEHFNVIPSSDGSGTRLTMDSESGSVRGRSGINVFGLRNLKFDIAASRHKPRSVNTQRRDHILDSLQRVYPGTPRDSLFAMARKNRLLQESRDEFASADIKLNLSDGLRKLVRNWDVEGNIDLGSGRIFMPAFPLKTSISSIQGSFDNDMLDLKSLTVNAGASDISAQAKLTGMRRAILGRGRSKLKLKADVQSNYLDVNELMRAYAYYTTFEKPSSMGSDEEVEATSESAELPDSTGRQLLVIPSNLDVNFTFEAYGIHYDSLNVSWAAADVAMRDRTVQVTNAVAASNMGDIYFEGFYSTRSKDDIKAGFDLNMVHITAEKVITLFPAVDTLMPLLTSFAGDLDCELAATADIDTCMRLVLPTVDGVLRISGKDLSLKESEEFTRLAKKLMFRNKSEARVDNMAVTGIVRDNRLEVFPFVLDVDRYLFAASGVQHLSKNFDYHISVIRSPLPLKFGVNAWGDDFSNVHYSVGKAKYQDVNVPVYTKQLDTVQYSLVSAIHNIFELGVEKAMKENRDNAQELGAIASGTSRLEAIKQELIKMIEAYDKQ